MYEREKEAGATDGHAVLTAAIHSIVSQPSTQPAQKGAIIVPSEAVELMTQTVVSSINVVSSLYTWVTTPTPKPEVAPVEAPGPVTQAVAPLPNACSGLATDAPLALSEVSIEPVAHGLRGPVSEPLGDLTQAIHADTTRPSAPPAPMDADPTHGYAQAVSI